MSNLNANVASPMVNIGASDIWNLTEGSLGECCSVMVVNVWVCYDT